MRRPKVATQCRCLVEVASGLRLRALPLAPSWDRGRRPPMRYAAVARAVERERTKVGVVQVKLSVRELRADEVRFHEVAGTSLPVPTWDTRSGADGAASLTRRSTRGAALARSAPGAVLVCSSPRDRQEVVGEVHVLDAHASEGLTLVWHRG